MRKFGLLPAVPGTEAGWEEMPWLMRQGERVLAGFGGRAG
ncbi:hypothetical protein HD597_004444 [Nonomuraea thailandensis]|uniref:Uncharacterized protein n=1 Tax=Nonomuraea thailandensis TaxID=1188745 RepID=A0A9X2GH58_9ACTN|nr:hypothetical protein [Nonomuraea thailandensis]